MPSIETTTAPDLDALFHQAGLYRDLYPLVPLTAEQAADHTERLLRALRGAYAWAERYTARRFYGQTLRAVFDAREAASPITLPGSPVRSVTSVTTYDDADAATTVASTLYRLEGKAASSAYVDDARLVAVSGGWSPLARSIAAVRVVYVCGYTDPATPTERLPDWAEDAILGKALQLFYHRLPLAFGTTAVEPRRLTSPEDLLWPHRLAA